MDFWDLTKLLVRRWMIGLPMLLLSCGLAALTLFAVKPDYTTTAHIQLVPPVTGATQPGQSTIDQRNPWIGLGLQALGNAAIVTVTDQSVLDQMHANGYSDSYTATMAESSPLISFEIVATSPDQARATTEELASRFTRSIVDQQSASGVAPKDMIIARRLDMATTVVKSSSKVKRAVVGVAGAGFLLTAGVTVGADAWLNRRRRRKEEAAGEPAVKPSQPRLPTPRTEPAARPEPIGRRGNNADITAVISLGNGTVPAGVGRDGTRAEAGAGQPAAGWTLVDGEHDAEQVVPMPSDATIILPVSLADRAQWTRKSGNKS